MPRLRTPGPGAYNTPSHLTIGGRTSDRRPSASFASNSSRQSKGHGDSLGDPGAYDLEHGGVHLGKKEPISARSRRSHNRDINLGKGSFISTSSRSTSAPPRSMRGGPGEHDYQHLYSCGHGGHGGTAAFRSALPLGGHIRKSDTPGIGEYDPNDKARFMKTSFSKSGSPMFAGSLKSRSASTRSTTGEHIGPGSYDLENNSINHKMMSSVNPRLPGFGSSSVRGGPED
jgi:hypothetical protein